MTCLYRHRGEVEVGFNLFATQQNPVPIVQYTGWASGPVWRAQKISHPLGFNPRTVQPVASHYTDYTTLTITG